MKNRRHQRRKRLQKYFTEKRQRQELSSEYERGYREGQHDMVMSLARVADKILDAVERIPASTWMNSQLSISRHFGGCSINGYRYFVDPCNDDLVREDVWRKEAKESADKKKKANILAAAKQNKLF